MAHIALVSHRESRLNLDAAQSGSTIVISLPSQSSLPYTARKAARRELITEDITGLDEIAFAQSHLASESSVVFRKNSRYPRTFLWRLLENRTVLEIQSVDLYQTRSPKHQDRIEALFTIRLRFSDPIQPFSIAFADSDETEALIAFALTTAGELYTINLQKEFFIRAAATELSITEWCRIYSPSSFGFRYPYRLTASGALELWIALHEGSLLRLTRKSIDDHWHETFYSEGGWSSSFRGLLPWKGNGTTRWGNIDLEPSAAAAVGATPDGRHVFTICLNHTLRSWNKETGKVGIHMDLLNDKLTEPGNGPQYLISAAQPRLLQIVNQDGPNGELYYIVTYSPKRHQFKIWAVLDADNAENGIIEVQSEVELIPPVEEMMNTSIWSLEEFIVRPSPRWKKTQICVRVKAGTNCVTYIATLSDFSDTKVLSTEWKENWTKVDPGGQTFETFQTHLNYLGDVNAIEDSAHYPSSVEKWVEFLFHPGRFSTPTLETALSVYNRGLEKAGKPNNDLRKGSLRQRIWKAITCSTYENDEEYLPTDYSHYEARCTLHWRNFYGLVRDLHKRRCEVLSVVYDDIDNIYWLALSDHVSPIRQCSAIELLRINSRDVVESIDMQPSAPMADNLLDPDDLEPLKLLNAASQLRKGLPEIVQSNIWNEVVTEIKQIHNLPILGRLELLEERIGLVASLSDDEYDKMAYLLDDIGGFFALSNRLFVAIIDKLTEEQRGHHSSQDITRYGSRLLIRGAQETLNQNIETLLDLLVLVLVLATEVEPSQLSSEFNPIDLYQILMTSLKEHLVLYWLATTTYQSMDSSQNSSTTQSQDSRAQPTAASSISYDHPSSASSKLTVLEYIFIGDWSDMLFPTEPFSSLLTYWCRAWTFGASLQEQYDAITCHIMGKFLRHRKYDLALEFVQFLPQTSWAIYLLATLKLALGDCRNSAIYFKKVAYGVSSNFFDVEQNDSGGLLDPEEHRYFSDGLDNYYQHVMALYERVRAHAYVVEFAQLALVATGAADTKDETAKSNILSRMFSACMQLSRFKEAYTVLIRYTNPFLLKSALTTFTSTLIAQNRASLLLTLPFANLQAELDATLYSLACKVLNPLTGPPYHKHLAAFRLLHDDFRGAAVVLYAYLKRLQGVARQDISRQPKNKRKKLNKMENASMNRKLFTSNTENKNDKILDEYLAIINILASVNPAEAWLLAEPLGTDELGTDSHRDKSNANGMVFGGDDGGIPNGLDRKEAERQKSQRQAAKRKLVTLADIRREYQDELDRIAALETGRFPIVEGFGDRSFAGANGSGYESEEFDGMDIY